MGIDAVDRTGRAAIPSEVRVRICVRTATADAAAQVGAEVEALYTNGPFGGGGATRSVRRVVAVASTLIPADEVHPCVTILEV
jgi:hypothetical protein